MTPGSGWKYLASGVREHAPSKIGVKPLHSGAMLRTASRDIVPSRSLKPELLDHLVSVNGGNRKRGAMACTKARMH